MAWKLSRHLTIYTEVGVTRKQLDEIQQQLLDLYAMLDRTPAFGDPEKMRQLKSALSDVLEAKYLLDHFPTEQSEFWTWQVEW
jgi:septation ring formation regulator EzrA